MINYLSTFTNTDGASFPDTLGKNATGPGATDGTEFVKAMVDDEWGARYALLDYTGMTPNGVTEGPGASQVIEAMNYMSCAPGVETKWNLAAVPGTTNHRVLALQGQGILIASYPTLVPCYVGDGNNAAVAAAGGAFYRADDAAGTIPNIAGAYLILPESRGVVERGLDTAASIDPDGASRFLGDPQIDSFQGHWHQNIYAGASINAIQYEATSTAAAGAGLGAFSSTPGADLFVQSPYTDGVNGTPRTSSETRMYNRATISVLWY